MCRRFVVSTIGTSILTNLIDNRNPAEARWRSVLRDSANQKEEGLTPEAEDVIGELADRALDKLLENCAQINRRISAELNGIYGIYNDRLPENTGDDQHWLICTDTAQGYKTGELIRLFLESQGFTVNIFTPDRLSTQDTASFTTGTKELIKWLEENVPSYLDRDYDIIFNLVGGFKSLQGYMNTFGAFYADEVIYIFEASTADLIKIPRLPIQIDTTVIQNHLTQFALMDAGHLYLEDQIAGIPETLLEFIEENGTNYAGLSAWGQLIWNRTKKDLLTKELLRFPRLNYKQTFCDDFRGHNNAERLKLQEALAKVAHLLEGNSGNTGPLTEDAGLKFGKLQGHQNIYSFRIAQDHRVTCSVSNGVLSLRRYRNRKDVYKNP